MHSHLNKLYGFAGFLILSAIVVLFIFAARVLRTSSATQQSTNNQWPTRGELWQSIRQSGGMITVYPGEPAALAEAYKKYYESTQRPGGRFRQRVLSDHEFANDSLGLAPLVLSGALRSNKLLAGLLQELPIEILSTGFRFRGEEYRDSTDVLLMMYPNPRNRKMLLSILTGNSDGAILRLQRQFTRAFNRVGDYTILRDGQVIAFGFFQDNGPDAWNPDAAEAYDLLREQKPVKQTEHFSFVTHGDSISKEMINELGGREETNLQKLISDLGVNITREIPRLTIHLWDNLEKKGLFTGETRLSHTDESRNEVHLVYSKDFRGGDFVEEAKWFIAKVAGQTASPALREGLAVAMSDRWRGVGYRGWAARLVKTGNAPPLSEIFQAEIWAAESDLVRQPLLGSFAEFLLLRWGAEKFLAAYRVWPENDFPSNLPNGDSRENVIAEWEKDLRTQPAVELRPRQTQNFSTADFHHGFCYAHEGYQIRNGYLGSLSRQSLQKLAELNVNAISVTPFGYLRAANHADFLRRSSGARSESDESLVQAKIFAERLGMRVMLKPHILMMGGDWGWPGAVKMETPKDWEVFFNQYARWMLHYAMLAEIYDFDSLCIGVELVQASYQHEQVWREMIAKWRKIYSGPMFYAANWGQEFESISFWDALDAIGLNSYYPLSEKENPTDKELLSGAQSIAEKIDRVAKKFRKPVLISEIGFTSSARPWLRPHDDNTGAPLDLEAQRRCYETIFQAVWGKPWLAGIYWWKWPTTLDDGGTEDDNFTPNGKPAAEVVAHWYGKSDPSESRTGR